MGNDMLGDIDVVNTVSNVTAVGSITGNVNTKFVDENNTPYYIKHVNNKPRVSSMPYLYDIAEGNVSDHAAWTKIGYNGDVDAGTEDMISQGGQYVFPAVATKMDIVSSSVEDDPDKGGAVPGTGIHTVTLYYLDSSGNEQSEDINLNGTAAVTTSGTIFRVQNIRAKVVGTNKSAVGNITLSETGGTTYKYGYVAIGQTRQRQCTYTVPTGHALYVTSIGFSIGSATKDKSAVFTTLATYDNKANAVRTFFFPFSEVIIQDGSYQKELEIPTKLPAGTDLKVQVRGLVADCVCSCILRGWMETT